MGLSYAVAVLFLIFFNHMEQNKNCRNGAKERERHVVSPVTKWYQSFLKSGETATSEKFVIGVGKVRDLPNDILSGSENTNLNNLVEMPCILQTNSDDDSESDDCNEEIISKEDARNIISRARVMMNLTAEVFKKEKAPIMSNNSNWLDHKSSLLLFSHPHSTVMCDDEKASERLSTVVRDYGFELVQVPGVGDCCFISVGFAIERFFLGDPSPPTDHLTAIKIYKDQDQVERVLRLRELLVREWLGDYSHDYEMFLTIAEKSSFYEMAEQFIQRGVFDCELGNSVLLALSNVLKCPIVIFTSIDTYPVIPLIPREAPLSAVLIYVAFNQSGKGHYDAIKVLQTEVHCSPKIQSKSIESSCRCGQGRTKIPRKYFVQITVLDVNVFRKFKGAVTIADVEIVIILMENE